MTPFTERQVLRYEKQIPIEARDLLFARDLLLWEHP
jgi:hypothetical protein